MIATPKRRGKKLTRESVVFRRLFLKKSSHSATQEPCYSESKKRNKCYTALIQSANHDGITVNDMIHSGHRLMRKARLHPHFFGGNSLLVTAQYLVFYALQLPHDYQNPGYLNKKITAQEAIDIIALFEKRIAARMPVEYITNESWYLGNKFYVNEHVLVPRSIMNTRFKDFSQAFLSGKKRVLDLCTGSGCIGITLALLNPEITVDLVDISASALDVAAINVKQYHLNSRVTCIQSDLFENVSGQYDLIITNPPYVTASEYKASPAEFKNEPKLALECGEEGLEIIHKILAHAKNHLTESGKLIAEVGYTAAKRLKKQYPKVPFTWFKYRRPTGKEPFLGMHGVFLCDAKGLLLAVKK